MMYGSLLIAAAVITCRNVVSFVIKYALLRQIYKMEPRLAVKHDAEDGKSKYS